MCGIVGAVAERDVTAILMEGLRRLEYRGYDSAGMAVLDGEALRRHRAVGKVAALDQANQAEPIHGQNGIAHTRWATHGKPTQTNAHPHLGGSGLAVVHNGIVENHAALRDELIEAGYGVESETDTEVIANLIQAELAAAGDLREAVRRATARLTGAYALGVISANEPERMIAVRKGSPLLVGVGVGEHFIASDMAALLPVTQRYIVLEEDDIADIGRDALTIHDRDETVADRRVRTSELSPEAIERQGYRHFMAKEIHEQPNAVAETLRDRLTQTGVDETALGPDAASLLAQVRRVKIVACGTSYHAGLVARYWCEELANLPCEVETASEFRCGRHAVAPGTLFLTLSQSGETADTLAALGEAQAMGYLTSLAICNVPESSLVRESDLVLMTRAGPEIGVASTKAFVTQLTALLLVVIAAGRIHGLSPSREAELVDELRGLPRSLEAALELESTIAALAADFVDKRHALFLGRGAQYPVAMEGALKLKEISYIHAEAYPAGELKHGPLALIDSDMPVVATAVDNELIDKLLANLQEVRAREGRVYVFAGSGVGLKEDTGQRVEQLPNTSETLAPIVYTVPLQLLAYHVAVLKGTDVDKPRNLAKSVTVE
jgi:glucosamine--fructose-6-phosphate aminotransferase (isomerizing)